MFLAGVAQLLDGPVGRPEVLCSEAVVGLVGGMVETNGFIVPETAVSLCVQLLKLILSLVSRQQSASSREALEMHG